MTETRYNNWLFNLHIKINQRVHAASVVNNSKPYFPADTFQLPIIKELEKKEIQLICNNPFLAIRKFITWIAWNRTISHKECNICDYYMVSQNMESNEYFSNSIKVC
jgi:hypothetical protein